MKKRTQRRDVIREIVRQNKVRTQKELAELLQVAGYECTQATISRDIADIGLMKTKGGCYVMPEDLRLHRMVSELVEEIYVTGNMVIVKTYSGGAPGVAGAIDTAGLLGSLGTVAGDNTIMIAARSPEDALSVQESLNALREG